MQNPSLSEETRPRHKLTIKYYYGVVYIAKRDRDRAETYFNEAFEGAQKVNWQRGMIYAQQFLADIARAQGMFDKAEELLKTGLEVAERNKDKRRTAYYERSLAYLALHQWRHSNERDRLNEAISWAQQALGGFERLGMQPEVSRLHRLLKRIEVASSLPSVEEDLPEQTDISPSMA
jgi:tetratricopeptide (TPR) repeat protein